MTKLTTIALIVSFACAGTVFAASSNGTRILDRGKIEAGYEYNNMFRRPLDRSYGSMSTADNFFILSVGVFDWLTLDGKIGLGDEMVKGGIHLPKLQFSTGFAGGYGFKVKFFEHDGTGLRILAGAQHICVHPQARNVNGNKYETILDDWQVSGLVTRKFRYLTPYLGMKLSDCEFIISVNEHDKKRRYSLNHIGFIFGSDFWICKDKIRLNVEGRLFDENAFSTAVAYMF